MTLALKSISFALGNSSDPNSQLFNSSFPPVTQPHQTHNGLNCSIPPRRRAPGQELCSSRRSPRPVVVPNLRDIQDEYALQPSVGTLPKQVCSPPTPGLIRKYTKDHEWIDISADNKTGVVGISTYAAEQLGDVVYVELPEVGDFVEQGDAIGAVESVKSASDINAPLRLKVTSVNSLLEEKPSTINKLPEDDSNGGGWIAKVEVDEESVAQLDTLMDAEAYKAFAGSDH